MAIGMDTKGIINGIASKTGIDPAQGQAIIDALIEVIGQQAAELDTIAVPAFGTFEPKKRTERVNVHPATGKRTLLPPKIVLTFKPSAILKQKISKH